jgi:hypothetical protein
MTNITARQAHIDTALTNISIGYRGAGFIADQIFPMVPVSKQSNRYFVFTRADWLRDEAQARAPGTRAARVTYNISSSPFVCVEYADAVAVPDELSENADAPLQPLVTATQLATDKLELRIERDVIGKVFGTGWSASATPSTVWSNDAAVPLDDMETAMYTVESTIGQAPNVGVIGRGLWRYLKNHPEIQERVKYGATPANPANVTLQAVAALCGLQRLLLTNSIYETSAEGVASSQSFVGGNHMWFGFVPGAAALNTPSAGYIFTFRAREVRRYREDQEHQDVIEARQSWDTRLTAPDAGYLIKSAA